jgi:hypothetical protein
MKNIFLGIFLLYALACSAQVPVRPIVSEEVRVTSAQAPISLLSVLAGEKTMLLVVDAASSKAVTWVEQLKASDAAGARARTVVMLSYAAGQEAKVAQLIQSSPGIRFVEDPGLAAMRALKLPGLPAMLGIAPDGTIVFYQMGGVPGVRSVVDVIDSWLKKPTRS